MECQVEVYRIQFDKIFISWQNNQNIYKEDIQTTQDNLFTGAQNPTDLY